MKGWQNLFDCFPAGASEEIMGRRNFGVSWHGHVQPNGSLRASPSFKPSLLTRFKRFFRDKDRHTAENPSASAEARWPKFQVIQGGKA
jgi:hypothetical protein